MNSKQLVLDAIYNRETERAPWVPFVGCHAAALTGVSAEEYFKSSENIIDGVFKAYEQYRPDGIPVLFDLQVEAEAMGCELKYAADNPPSVVTHPLEQGVNLEDMMEAVKAAAAPFGESVRYIEHKIKHKESVVCMLKLGVKNLPTIVIDGKIKYVSIIPDVEELKKSIQEALESKAMLVS